MNKIEIGDRVSARHNPEKIYKVVNIAFRKEGPSYIYVLDEETGVIRCELERQFIKK